MVGKQKIVISSDLQEAIAGAVAECAHDKLFTLVDETTDKLCLPLVSGFGCMADAQKIVIGASDTSKTLDTMAHVWSELQRMGATRHSLMVNIGGGMVTDLGGFAASTFKRGIGFINVPTTLLAMVDASVGGKTGINFGGLKNEIGVFNNANSVVLDTCFLRTMDTANMCSGYAEMLKHGLISDERTWAQLVRFDIEKPDLKQLQAMVTESVAVKERVVQADPTEHGIRKALNFGHTFGHAFESLALEREPILHGYAVAYGMVCELYLSTVKAEFPAEKLRQTVNFITEHYGKMPISCDDYPRLKELMRHDKKNVAGRINFTLLGGIGDIRIDQTASENEIDEAFDFYCDGC